VLRIVFPAHVDGAGRFHETSIVQAVVDGGQWLAATEGHGPELASTNVLNVEPEILSQLGAPEKVAALSPIDRLPDAAGTALASAENSEGAPSNAAVSAARAKAHAAAPIKRAPTRTAQVTSAKPQVASNRPATFNPHVED
ncbi:MAG: conjugal transfer protein, partial [Pseudomonadota bacterium]|nr:conjugal transfer protein [Pseudomonadota bacterium]